MSQKEKLIRRLRSRPRDMTYAEIVRLLGCFGFKEDVSTPGSSVCFWREADHRVVHLHKPHGSDPVKMYVIDNIIERLKEYGDLNEQ